MFTIDFTKPWLYKDIIYFNQGNLSTNNTLRCKLVTGGSDDFTGGSIACTFTTKDSVEISGFGKLIDAKSGIIDIVFPSNALVVGSNKLEVLVNRADGGVAQSPPIIYDIWQGLTTGKGIEAETNYPILIELINSVNEASNQANATLDRVNAMQIDITEATDNAYRSANDADIAASNANTKIEEVETAKTEMIKKVDTSIVTMKSDVEVAKNEMASKADEKIADVDRALAAGTVDLELKEARKDASGVVHDTVKQRLDSDLIVGDKSLKDFVIDMNGMKESQDLSYDTDTGYKVCQNTKNGVVKDLKVYGKTVVNALPKLSKLGFGMGGVGGVITSQVNGVFTGISSNDNYYVYDGENIAKSLYPNSQYTTKGFVEIDCTVAGTINVFYISLVDGVNKTRVIKSYKLSVGKNYVPINEVFTTDSLCNGTCGFYTNNVGTINSLKFMFMMLQGNVTNLTIDSHVEGIASVGNGNQIEVLSRKEDGNLFNPYQGVAFDKSNWVYDGNQFNINSNQNYLSNWYYVQLEPNTKYYIKADLDAWVRVYKGKTTSHGDGAHQLGSIDTVRRSNIFTTDSSGWITVRLTCETKQGISYIKNLIIAKFDIPYVEYKQDKKPVLFKDTDGTWKPVTELKEWDVLDTTKNLLNIGCKKFVIDGNEQWEVYANNDNSKTFSVKIPLLDNMIPHSLFINDKLKYLSPTDNIFANDTEGISLTQTVIAIRIDKTKLATQDIEGVKKWLQSNNITIIYQLANKEIYEINPIYPDSFEGDTMVLFNGGAIAPYAEWKMTCNLTSFLSNIEGRVSRLENDAYKVNLANFAVALNTLDVKARLEALEAPIN